MLTVLYGPRVQGAKGGGDLYLGYLLSHASIEVHDLESLAAAVHDLQDAPNAYVIRGGVKEDAPPRIRRRYRHEPYHLEDTQRQWLCVDIDGLPSAHDVFAEPERAVAYARSTLPIGLAHTACYYAITGSAKQHSLHVHLWFWLDRTYTNAEIMRDLAGRCDKSLYKPTQPHFTAAPVIANDPLIGRRRGVLGGDLEGWLGAEPMKADPAMAEQHLQAAMNDIVGAKPGDRHRTVNRRSYFMGRHVACKAIASERVIEVLISAAMAAKMPEERARSEVVRALKDGIQAAPFREQWVDKLEANKDGVPRSTYLNCVIAMSESAEWHGCLGYSQRSARTEWIRTPPTTNGYSTAVQGSPMRDEHAAVAASWLSTRGMSFARRALIETMIDVSHKNPFDPLRNLLDELDWDGKPRLTEMLSTYFGITEAEQWARIIGRKWMISAIARVYKPGCKADNILILEGEQGRFKSTALEVLGMGFAKEVRVKLDEKDASDALHSGAWIAVLSELDAFKATSRAEAVKAFLSMPEDYYRQAYARTTTSFPRSIVFAATTNEETYLNDPTGNRRFWPIKVGGIDIVALRDDVEQLWAEARQAYLSGEHWWIEDDDDKALADSEQRKRLLPDSWEQYIESYVEKNVGDISIPTLLEHSLEMLPTQQSPANVSRVIRYLRRLGYGMHLVDGDRVWRKVAHD